VGAHPSGLLGEDPNGTPNNLMPIISEVALGKRTALEVFGNDYPTPDGTCIRDYLHVVDLARGHVKALDYSAAAPGCEAVNLGTGRGLSVLELVKAFEQANGIKIPLCFSPRRAGDIPECYADTAKAKRLLGWEAKLGAKEMCADVWRWLKSGN
jgi:UDP-glucose 4-epimerase